MTGAGLGLGVIGWPIAHSRSPAMQNAALGALGLEQTIDYQAFPVEPHRLREFVESAAARGIRGLNVTIPHKEAALALCTPDTLAERVGAVNTLSFEEGAIHGTNTDLHGFYMLMKESGAGAVGDVVILGAGGATRAVVAVLQSTASRLTIVSRSPRTLVVGGAKLNAVPWPSGPQGWSALLRDATLLVDATPRGLDPRAPPIDLSTLATDAVVLDLVVRRQTALVTAAQARGLRAATGTAMLLHQGAASLERWLGRPAPIAVMRAALLAALE